MKCKVDSTLPFERDQTWYARTNGRCRCIAVKFNMLSFRASIVLRMVQFIFVLFGNISVPEFGTFVRLYGNWLHMLHSRQLGKVKTTGIAKGNTDTTSVWFIMYCMQCGGIPKFKSTCFTFHFAHVPSLLQQRSYILELLKTCGGSLNSMHNYMRHDRVW